MHVTSGTNGLQAPALKHIAIIMDGNGRWASQRGLPSAAGHKQGVERVRDILEACRHIGIEVLTLFAFSSENWSRPKIEVAGLMTLFSIYLKKETAKLKAEGVRIRVIGGRDRFSEKLKKQIEWAEKETENGHMTLVLAVDYGGRWDIVEGTRKIAQQIERGELKSAEITEQLLGAQITLSDLPEVDLLIRTSGELRISNFLLWQCAYSEFYFTDVYWPDFDEPQLQRAISDYYLRQRRFGLRAEQLVDVDAYPLNAEEDDNSYV